MLHMINTKAELWQSGVVFWRSDLEHRNTIYVWTTLSEAHFMDLDFTLWGMGI
jgi:hypothetical protein